ncbi:MAG: DUF459 domain-containing protein [bacterium]
MSELISVKNITKTKTKFSEPQKAILILLIILAIVPFFESRRIAKLAPSAKTEVMKTIGNAYSDFSEMVKNVIGVQYFFDKEDLFWNNLKISPLIFNYPPPFYSPGNARKYSDKISAPFNILIVGDSFIAEGFGPLLEKELLNYENTTIVRHGVYSTGLSRPDYFNWQDELNKLIDSVKPNIVIVMFGANDAQDIKDVNGKTLVHYGDDNWNDIYGKNVATFLDILKDNKVFALWIGNPIARDEYYRTKIENLNSVFEKTVKRYDNAIFLSTWNTLADKNGNYTAYLPGKNDKVYLARASDGIHATQFGALFIVDEVITALNKNLLLTRIDTDSSDK